MGFQNISCSRFGCADGDTSTAANLHDYAGYVVKDEGSNFCSICDDNDNSDDRPLGILTNVAEDSTSACLTVVCNGRADALAGDTITPGPGNGRVMVDATGRVIPLVVPADGPVAAGVYSVGWIDSHDGVAVAVNEKIRIFVDPQWHSNRYAPQE